MTPASVYWFTGLSGVGKSTIAEATKTKLESRGLKVLILDGDVIRRELHHNLGFSESDIIENNRLISELCVKQQHDYDIILVPIISPFKKSRSDAKKKIGKSFFEIYVEADLETLSKRDTKGLYKRARNSMIDNLIGVSKSIRYDKPKNPDFKLNTNNSSIENTIYSLLKFIETKSILTNN